MHLFVFITTLLIYTTCWVSPKLMGWIGYGSMLLPIVLCYHLFYLLYMWFFRRQKAWYSIFALLVGAKFILLTFTFSFQRSASSHFSVLSYNVKRFDAYEANPESKDTQQVIEWLKKDTSTIKCFQEFYDLPASNILQTVSILGKDSNYHTYFHKTYSNGLGGTVGMAIFSKYPIIAKGSINLGGQYDYGAVYADILIAKDTIRIYNLHLQSMSLAPQKLFQLENIVANYCEIEQHLRQGFVMRAGQIEKITSHLQSCPYPIVLCGDLNELPYSYVYHQLSQSLDNAFEKAGRGFGFTYNGLLFFLRIDNQFYSPTLRVTFFDTITTQTYSDHFPIKTGYSLL